jgi:hypothetical protein
MAVGEAFPTGSEFLLAKSSFPSLKTPTVLSQQELENPVGKAFANRVGVFANSSKLLAKHAFPVVFDCFTRRKHTTAILRGVCRAIRTSKQLAITAHMTYC